MLTTPTGSWLRDPSVKPMINPIGGLWLEICQNTSTRSAHLCCSGYPPIWAPDFKLSRRISAMDPTTPLVPLVGPPGACSIAIWLQILLLWLEKYSFYYRKVSENANWLAASFCHTHTSVTMAKCSHSIHLDSKSYFPGQVWV